MPQNLILEHFLATARQHLLFADSTSSWRSSSSVASTDEALGASTGLPFSTMPRA